jgi:hypothetical protein
VLFIDASQERRLDVERMGQWFRTMGFTLKVESRAEVFERIEFCQSNPVWNGEHWVMCRRHGVAMSKDCTSLKPLDTPRVFDKWRTAVGQCGLALASGVPVQQSFYQALMRGSKQKALSDPTMETGMARLAVGLASEARPITPLARYSYWAAFGCTPDEQVALEGVLDRTTLAFRPPVVGGTNVPPTELLLFKTC